MIKCYHNIQNSIRRGRTQRGQNTPGPGSGDDATKDDLPYMPGVTQWDKPKGNGAQKLPQKKKPTEAQVKKWQESIENLLDDPKGISFFNRYLMNEYASENLDFWKAVQDLKQKRPQGDKLKKAVREIFDMYIGDNAEKQINVNGKQKSNIQEQLETPDIEIFDETVRHCVRLMKEGAYLRFIDMKHLSTLLRDQG